MPELKNESKIPVGQVLVGKYRVIREIGRGGMAAVYEAEHLALGKKVAVKVLAAELSASTIVIERFFREARAAASVKSPYIVDIYDSGRLEDGRPFIAMEMLEGESLYDRMTRVRLIDPHTTVRIITQCAKGLMKAHSAGIVHRDLKPENIFILHADEGGEEQIKLLDFGLAKFYAPMKPDEKTARLTREGAVFGTPAYMSPEQVKGQGSVDHRADLWALGCMAFECLTGRPVWNTDQGVAMTFASIAAAQLPIPSKLRPELPPAFDEWFKHALERDANKRFQTAKELADALARAFGSGPISLISDLDAADTVAMKGLPAGLEADYDDEAPTVAGIPDQLAGAPPARGPGLSAVDLPPTASASGVSAPAPHPTLLRWVASSAALIGAVTLAWLAWSKVLRPQVLAPIVQSAAAVAPEGSASAGIDTPQPVNEPKWSLTIEDAQESFSEGNAADAQKKLKQSLDEGAPTAIVRGISEEMKAGAAASGACKMAAFSHPRLSGNGNAHLPSIANGAKGAVVTWNDDHEQPGHDHVYSVVVDPVGHPVSKPRDLTPEATDVGRASLLPVSDRMVLLYWDGVGREAGVRVRWIDEDGRIGGDSVLVGGAHAGNYWPAIERAPDGFFVAWQDDRDRGSDDLYLRHLGQQLEPLSGELRATDYVASTKPALPIVPGRAATVGVRTPSVAVAGNALYIAYELERDPKSRLIQRMRLPLGAPELATGLDAKAPPRGAPRKDRELDEVTLVNEDKLPSDSPTIACGSEGCFLAWHGEQGGAYVALIDPVEGHVVWRKNFSARGVHPTLASSVDGIVMVAYYEASRVRMALLTRDGVGPPSTVARVTGDQPRPWLASARTGEWLLAWQDAEERHAEVYAARVVCK